MRSTSMRGLRSSSWLSWMPIWCSVDILRFSTNTSDCSTRRMSSSRASGRRGSMVHDSLLRAIELFIAWRLYGRSSTPSIAGAYIDSRLPSSIVAGRPRQVALGGRREHRRVLDPDHLGAEVGEQLREVRTRPHRGEVEDADPAQRWLVGVAVARRGPVAAPAAPRAARSAARARGGAAASRPRRSGTGGPGSRTSPSTGSSTSTQNPRWWKWSASITSAGVYTPASGHCPAWACAVASARVCSNSHGYSAVSRISLVSGFGERVGSRERRGQRVVVDHLEHLLELLRRRHHRHVAVGAREDADGQQGVGRVARPGRAARGRRTPSPR